MRSLLIISLALIATATGMAVSPVARLVPVPADDIACRHLLVAELGYVPANVAETIESQSPLFDVIAHALKNFRGRASNLGRPYTSEEKLELLALHKIFVNHGGRIVIDPREMGSHRTYRGEQEIKLSNREDFFSGTYLHELRHARDAHFILNRSSEKNTIDKYRMNSIHSANYILWTERNATRGEEQHVNYPYTEALRRLTMHGSFLSALLSIGNKNKGEYEGEESPGFLNLRRQIESHFKTILENLIAVSCKTTVPLLGRRELANGYEQDVYSSVKFNFNRLFQTGYWKSAHYEQAVRNFQYFFDSPFLTRWIKAKIRYTFLKDLQRIPFVGEEAWQELLLYRGEAFEYLTTPTALKKILLQRTRSHSTQPRYTQFEKTLTNTSRLPFAAYRRALEKAVINLTAMNAEFYRSALELNMLTLGYTACPDAGDLDKNPQVLDILNHAVGNAYNRGKDAKRFLRPSVTLLKKNLARWTKSDKFKQMMANFKLSSFDEVILYWYVSHGVKPPLHFWKFQDLRLRRDHIRNYLAIAKKAEPQGWVKRMEPALLRFLSKTHYLHDEHALRQALNGSPPSTERSKLLKLISGR